MRGHKFRTTKINRTNVNNVFYFLYWIKWGRDDCFDPCQVRFPSLTKGSKAFISILNRIIWKPNKIWCWLIKFLRNVSNGFLNTIFGLVDFMIFGLKSFLEVKKVGAKNPLDFWKWVMAYSCNSIILQNFAVILYFIQLYIL